MFLVPKLRETLYTEFFSEIRRSYKFPSFIICNEHLCNSTKIFLLFTSVFADISFWLFGFLVLRLRYSGSGSVDSTGFTSLHYLVITLLTVSMCFHTCWLIAQMLTPQSLCPGCYLPSGIKVTCIKFVLLIHINATTRVRSLLDQSVDKN